MAKYKSPKMLEYIVMNFRNNIIVSKKIVTHIGILSMSFKFFSSEIHVTFLRADLRIQRLMLFNMLQKLIVFLQFLIFCASLIAAFEMKILKP
jgi:hypothetical protein